MILPRVSIIIPTFNRAAFLKESIESVFAQSFKDWELVIVDDGSNDSTFEIVESFKDPRINYIRQNNRGVSAARNAGVARSTAPLIAFLDSDDLWLPEKLKTQISFFDANPEIAVCQTEEIWMRRGVRVNPALKHAKRSGWIFKDCLPLCIVSPSAVMIRRKVFDELGGFDESFPACEDYDLWLRTSLRYEIHTLSDALIVKRGGHLDQLSRQWGLDRWRIAALEKIFLDSMLDAENRSLVVNEIVRRSKIIANGADKRGNKKLCEFYAEKAEAFSNELFSVMNSDRCKSDE